jgi:hypothetical protein
MQLGISSPRNRKACFYFGHFPFGCKYSQRLYNCFSQIVIRQRMLCSASLQFGKRYRYFFYLYALKIEIFEAATTTLIAGALLRSSNGYIAVYFHIGDPSLYHWSKITNKFTRHGDSQIRNGKEPGLMLFRGISKYFQRRKIGTLFGQRRT